MKRNIIYPLVTIGLFMTACNSFIDKQPLSDFTSSGNGSDSIVSKYASVSDAKAGLNGAYNAFKNDIFELQQYMLNDVQSDNCYLGNDEPAGYQFDQMTVNALNTDVAIDWKEYYELEGTATTVIENTRIMANNTISEADRNSIIAQGKFVRAYANFDIVRLWGDAPLLTKLIPPITNKNIDDVYPILYPPRTATDTIYQSIISDLTTALPYLPSSNKGAFSATKGGAYALLAKVTATRGAKTFRNYNQVVTYCDKVITEGYQLVANYDDLWNPDNHFTTESIFEIGFTTDDPNWAYWVLLKEEDGTVTWRRYCTPTQDLLAKYEPNDTRKNATWIWKSAPYNIYYPANNYPFAYKIREKNSDIILIRLADILLLKAEALVELNRIPEAMVLVNQIRQRAGLTNLNSTMTQDNVRLAVEKERQLELAMEGQRWFDLVRNDRMTDVMLRFKGKDGKPYLNPNNVQPFRSLLPIPQEEMDKNQFLTQNPGY